MTSTLYRNWLIFADTVPDSSFTEIWHAWRIKHRNGETWRGHAPTHAGALQAARNAVDWVEDGFVKKENNPA